MARLLALPIACLILLSGCATATPTSTSCTFTGLATLSPTPAAGDHNAMSPANQVQFSITGSTVTSRPAANASCAFPQVIGPPAWTSSDPINAPISNGIVVAGGPGNGLATCLGTTTVPATISVTQFVAGEQVSGSTTLTCK